MALGKLASCHCPPATLPEPRQKAAPTPHIFSHGVQVGTLPWPLSPRSGACWPAPWGDPHQGGPQCCICLQNLLGLAQVVSWARKPQLPIMCLVVPSEWDLRTRGALKEGGVWDAPSLPGAPYLHGSWPLGLPASLPLPGFLAHLLPPGLWPFKGWWAFLSHHPWLQSQGPGKKEGIQSPVSLASCLTPSLPHHA